MATEPKTLTPDMSASDAAGLMRQYDIGAVPIVENDRLVGLVTDRDLVVRVLAARIDPTTTRIDEIATSRDLVTVEPGASLSEAMGLMAEHRIKRLPVVHGDAFVGVVSIGDLANASASERQVGKTVAEILSSPATEEIDRHAPDPGTPARVQGARDGR
jgi:CBS domain-containing protein